MRSCPMLRTRSSPRRCHRSSCATRLGGTSPRTARQPWRRIPLRSVSAVKSPGVDSGRSHPGRGRAAPRVASGDPAALRARRTRSYRRLTSRRSISGSRVVRLAAVSTSMASSCRPFCVNSSDTENADRPRIVRFRRSEITRASFPRKTAPESTAAVQRRGLVGQARRPRWCVPRRCRPRRRSRRCVHCGAQ